MPEQITLTPTQRKILAEICRAGGSYASIFRLSINLQINYTTAHRNVHALRVSGHIRIELGSIPTGGRAAKLSLPLPVEKLPSWWVGSTVDNTAIANQPNLEP